MGHVSSLDGIYYDMKDNNSEEENVFDNENKIKNAIDWGNVNNKVIITPTGNLEELEKKWIDFNSMIKKHRRESDWKCIEIFGMTNQDVYTKLKSTFISNDIERYDSYDSIEEYIRGEDQPITESFAFDSEFTDITNAYYNKEIKADYSEDAIKAAKEWSEEYNRFIVLPTRTLNELEDAWGAYESMLIKHRRESDWKSIELFGMSNFEHYQYLKSKLLKADISNDELTLYDRLVKESSIYITDTSKSVMKYLAEAAKTEPKVDIIKAVLELYAKNNSVYDEILIINGISDVLDRCDETITSMPEVDVEFGDIPYISPEEMIDMGVYGQAPTENYYGEFADNTNINDNVTVAEWFKFYKNSSGMYYNEFSELSSDWVNKVRTLTHGLAALERTSDTKAINARKQSILELGWDPEVPFNDRSRKIVREIHKEKAMSNSFDTRFIDLREFNNIDNRSETENSEIHPIYVVLTEGKRVFSKIIKKATGGIYTHAGISFDSNLDNIYTFTSKGITIDNINDLDNDHKIRVFAFFVNKEKYSKVKKNIQYYMDNKERTHYSYLNLFTFLFKVNLNREWHMVCSQFVDRILKMSDLNITNSDSSLTSPNSLDTFLSKNRNVYIIYTGLVEKYSAKKVKSLINSLYGNANILESKRLYFNDEYIYIRNVINNIYNTDSFKYLKECVNIVSNDKIRNMLNDHIFIDIKPYCESTNKNEKDIKSLTSFSRLIKTIIKPL